MSRSSSLGVAVALICVGCAQVEPPPGGPPDQTPPSVITTRPGPDAVIDAFTGSVVFVFDERISERGIEDAVMVSPRTSPVEVRHGRDELRISLRRGWEPGRIYHVVVRPAVSDLFGNRLRQPSRLVFSTGPDIPETAATGRVTDRITGAPSVDIRVEAVRNADSLVYAVPTDSAGRYDFDRIPEGEYTLRAFEDLNRDRAMDTFEPQDSAAVSIRAGDPVEADLRILMPDTTPPVATAARPRDELLEIEFDDYLDPEQTVSPQQVEVVGPAGTIPVLEVTIAPAAAPGGGVRPPPQGQPAPAAGAGEPVPLPSRRLVVSFASATDLETPGEYRVSLTGVRNVNGLTGGSEITFTVDAPTPANVAAAFPGGPPGATLMAIRSRNVDRWR